MKWIVLSLLFLVPFLSFSQSKPSLKNGIGVHLTYDDLGGMGSSIRYTRQLGKLGVMKLEFKSNWNTGYAGRIGYEFLQMQIKDFELAVGVDLKYAHWEFEKFGVSDLNELSVELPIELRYHILPNYFIQTGISFSKRISSSENNSQPEAGTELRLGLGYRF